MKLTLQGHSELYAVEQLMMQLFPEEAEGEAVSTLSAGTTYLTATAKITLHGRTGHGTKRLPIGEKDNVRLRRRILQQSFYLAAVEVLGFSPPWGALAGVRPTKLVSAHLLSGGTEQSADKLLKDTYFVSGARRRLCIDSARHTVETARLLRPKDLSVYVGIPFCPTRCAYCSFVSQSVEKFGKDLAPYLDALEREIRRTGALLQKTGRTVRTLYMGGGTPTTLSAPQMERLLSVIRESFDLSECLEFTVEGGRPDTLDLEKLQVIRQGGADRMSINPQTMSDDVLRRIGRNHTTAQTLRAYEDAKTAGFDGINMDLIAGLPGDSVDSFLNSVEKVIALEPSNITVHTLALKKAAALYQSRDALPSGQAVSEMLTRTEEALRRAGYEPYYLYRQKYMSGSFENVGWCRPGFTGLYNICMMEELHTILSLGGGGMTKVNLGPGQLQRFHNPKIPADYVARIDQILAQKEQIFALLEETDSQSPCL